MSMFRQYDIRGIVDTDLTEEKAEKIGKAIGTYMPGTILIGKDNRIHGKRIRDFFVKGLLSTGCDVVDFGIVTSPILYFSSLKYKNSGAVMITASHNPKEYNGFKIIKNGKAIFGEEIQKLKRLSDGNDFNCGQGNLRFQNALKDYTEFILNKTNIKKKLKVVVDCGNGTASGINPEILNSLGCEIIKLYCESDGNFPNHEPDPVVEENLQELIETVKFNNADLGIAFDGDGDRLGMVDEKGNIIPGDKILIILARKFLQKDPNKKIIYEVKCSKTLKDEITKCHGIPIMYKTGHSFIKKKMQEEDAILAGEMSGHFFFKEIGFFDDALFAACKLLEIISESGKKVSELLDGVPKTYVTPEIRWPCPDNFKEKVIDELHFKFVKYNPLTIDGIRIEFEDGWGLVRASNTQPALVLRFEADSQERMNEIKSMIEREVKNVTSNTLDG
ncbi:MAG: phosphomannomutase/phosphoglucomutase [Nanoarchaeota archaeon]|nr:phosphomannomutase/phosphoglucomutase [Nanoarchaeota archaeon]